ncbi:MAG: CoA pyrophosphatase [Actinomycetota bacterium]
MAPAPHTFDDRLRRAITDRLAAHDVREHPLEGRRHAAVALCLLDSDSDLHGIDDIEVDRMRDLAGIPGVDPDTLTGRVEGTAGGASLLITRRGNLAAHARQWAFPGGRIDEGETPLEAAIREAEEEVGLALRPDQLLGRLDDYPTRSGYVMTPFVFWVTGQDPVANPGEVASVHRIGFHELQRADSPRFVDIPESDRPVVQIPIGGDLIHAPTGAIIHQFRAVGLDGQSVRVDEYEQPLFAWR